MAICGVEGKCTRFMGIVASVGRRAQGMRPRKEFFFETENQTVINMDVVPYPFTRLSSPYFFIPPRYKFLLQIFHFPDIVDSLLKELL
jgi:hypothetical protein